MYGADKINMNMKEKIRAFLEQKYKGSTRFIKPKLFINEFGKESFDEINSKINWINEPFSLKVFCYINDILIKPKCKMCGNDVKFNPTELKFQTYCSNSCRFKDHEYIKTVRDKTNLEKYGAANVFASKHGMEKIKQTNLEKYGVENYCKTEEYKQRLKSGEIKRPYCGDKVSHSIKLKYFKNLPNRYHNLIPLFNFEDYKGAHTYEVKYEWKCRNCGNIFLHWLNNNYDIKCKLCEKSGTNIEVFVENFLKRYSIPHFKRDKMTLNGFELDFNIPSFKIAIECNGLHWHNDEHKEKRYHLMKTEMCLERGIKLIHIFADEIENKPRQVENRLRSIFGFNKVKINARDCNIQNISHETSSKFLNKYHLQGADIASIRLGLFKKNRLVSIMTFSKSRKALGQNLQEGEYELTRFCSMGNVTVNGGAQKLISHFIRNYSPKKIMSFCDRRWSNGELYDRLNFTLVKKTDVNYWYVDKTCRKRYHRFAFAKQFLAEKLENFDPALSERENMKINGYTRIYDCGSLKYELIPQ
jgi:very-short-patch-repair endonuclease